MWGYVKERPKFTYVAPTPKKKEREETLTGKSAIYPDCVEYYPNFIDEIGLNPVELYQEFLDEFEFARRPVLGKLGQELYTLDRETCVYSDPDVTDAPPAIWGANNKLHPWTPNLEKIRDAIEIKTGAKYNICLCNYYANGMRKIGWHPDREERGSTVRIASVSIGEPRLFQLKENATSKIYDIRLANGSLFIMKDPCQRDYVHRVPEESNVMNGRINLTYRLLDKARYFK